VQFITASAAFVSLLILIALRFFKKSTLLEKCAKAVFLIANITVLNEMFFSFSFNQVIEWVVIILLVFPLLAILDSFRWSKRSIDLSMFIGSLTIIATVVFFKLIYEPYEAYWMNIPIIFIHYWLRNWLIFIGLTMLGVGIIKKTTANST